MPISSKNNFVLNSESAYINTFLNAFSNLKTVQHELYPSLENNLCITLKHLLVAIAREQFLQLELITGNPQQQIEKLNHFAQMDEQIKHQTYNLPIMDKLENYLAILTSEPLKKLAEDVSNPEHLLKQLEHAREDQYKKLISWENVLQEKLAITQPSLFISFQKKMEQLCLFVYKNSFINFSGELGLIFGDILSKQIDQNKINLPNLFKIIGIVFGFYYTIMAGFVAFIRLLALNQFALRATNYFTKPPVVDNTNVHIYQNSSAHDIQATKNICFNITAIFFAMLEAMYFQDAGPIVRMIAGLSGSSISMTLSKNIIKKINVTLNYQSLDKEKEMFILFLISKIGYELSQSFVGGIWQKSQAHDAVIKFIRMQEAKGELANVSIDPVDFYSPSALWFNKENPLHLRWQYPRDGFFYTTQCQIESPQEIYCRNPIKDFLTLSQTDFALN